MWRMWRQRKKRRNQSLSIDIPKVESGQRCHFSSSSSSSSWLLPFSLFQLSFLMSLLFISVVIDPISRVRRYANCLQLISTSNPALPFYSLISLIGAQVYPTSYSVAILLIDLINWVGVMLHHTALPILQKNIWIDLCAIGLTPVIKSSSVAICWQYFKLIGKVEWTLSIERSSVAIWW